MLSELEQYILNHTEPEDDLLKELYRETHVRMLHPRMASGHIQGKILEMFCHMIQAKNILEIGTYTGYSAICMAKCLPENGMLHTIEINDEIEEFTRSFFERSGLNNKIKFHIGDAREIIPTLHTTFDLVFIDGEKNQYCEYYEMVLPIVRTNGFIIADNVLWSEKVIEKNLRNNDHFAHGIKAFNDFIQKDNRVQNVLFPVRDGLMVMRKV